MAYIDDVDDDEQNQRNFTRTFMILLEWTVYAFQFIFDVIVVILMIFVAFWANFDHYSSSHHRPVAGGFMFDG